MSLTTVTVSPLCAAARGPHCPRAQSMLTGLCGPGLPPSLLAGAPPSRSPDPAPPLTRQHPHPAALSPGSALTRRRTAAAPGQHTPSATRSLPVSARVSPVFLVVWARASFPQEEPPDLTLPRAPCRTCSSCLLRVPGAWSEPATGTTSSPGNGAPSSAAPSRVGPSAGAWLQGPPLPRSGPCAWRRTPGPRRRPPGRPASACSAAPCCAAPAATQADGGVPRQATLPPTLGAGSRGPGQGASRWPNATDGGAEAGAALLLPGAAPATSAQHRPRLHLIPDLWGAGAGGNRPAAQPRPHLRGRHRCPRWRKLPRAQPRGRR